MYLRLEEYHRPESLDRCLTLLAEPGTAALAGGTCLNVRGHEDLRRVVDLQGLPLHDLTVEGGGVRIGAMTTLATLAGAALPASLDALAAAARAEPNLPLRNRSTLGGRLARGRSDGRIATALLALDAELEVHSAGARSTVGVGDWLRRDPLDRARLLTAAAVPGPLSWSGYLGFGQPAMAPPACDAALAVGPGGVRVATGGHAADAAGTLELPGTAAFVGGLKKGAALATWEPELKRIALAEVPAHGDLLAAGDWRQAVAVTLVVRLTERWLREGGGA